uniref:Si:ch211-241e1.3 n=1 Tax=Acanthochromis polyacanthus TaxID=80966 RepID=A0A3Q1GPD0_9TELE
MRGWRLESPDKEEVVSVLNSASNTVVADIQELPATVQTLHWVAPSSYLGNRVSKCAPGYYRDGSQPYLGRCVPCECNGLANECEDRTGRCLNCQYNTAGDRCERCKEGYYGNAAQRTCKVCPCPFTASTNSFAVGCKEEYGDIKCICRTGYTGNRCESCAPGYYGDPLTPGGSCRPCNCFGNGNNCDPRTGECDNCAQTLLHDLEKLDDELGRIKAQMDNATASASSQDKLKKLEKAISDTKVTCHCTVTLKAIFSEMEKKEYEQLAAQLDGAKRDLTEKVNEISKAPGKKDLVEKAEKHAKELEKLAKDLEDAVKNASGRSEVRNAKDAIDAYKNITDAINAAEAAANQARDAADNALDVKRAKELKMSSNDLVKEAQGAEKDLKDAVDDLNDLKKRQTNTITSIYGICSCICSPLLDDIDDMINEAKRKAASANDTATVLFFLIDFFTHYNFFYLIGFLFAVKNLLNTIPSLNDKISEVENLTSQFSPISNISENIKKIKELIEQARDAANRIGIPMKFKGDGHVELRPPKNLEDLKAYTSLSLSLQRPGQDSGRGDGRHMFVLYLGNRDSSKNYMGMVLRNGILYGVYKLNGREYEMKTGVISMSPSEPATFDKVDLRRIYQDAEMILTKDITSTTPGASIKSDNQGEESKNLLDISPSDIVFYVGGYPSNFTPPPSLNYPMYSGCIEFSSFNDRVISLYNFKKAEKINLETPCRRDNITMQPFKGCLKNLKLFRDFKPVDETVGISRGFTNIHIKSQLSLRDFFFFIHHRPHFSVDVRTRSPEGLLFFATTRGGRSHLALYMSKGRIRLSVGKQNEIFNREKYNDGKWHSVSGLEKKKFRLVVDGIRAKDGLLTNAELTSMQQFVSPVYLGSSKALPKQSISGCVRGFKMNGAPMSNPTTNHGAGPCFEGQTQRGAYFSGNGAHVIINDSFVVGSTFELLFSIRPRNLSGLLLHVGDSSRTHYGPAMDLIKCNHLSVHQLPVSPAEMLIQQALPVTSSFVGCIQDMKINSDPVTFDRSSGVFGPVNLKECPG